MKILILGDVMGPSGREAVKKNLSKVIEQNNISFAIINGENAADDGKGITKEIAEEFFSQGIDVITSGNHIWDKEETSKFIEKEERLLRPANLAEGSPGKGFGIFLSKDKKYKIAVINLMGNVFMRKTDDVFFTAQKIYKKIILKECGFFCNRFFHGEITSEKMAIGHYFDGNCTCVVGTHTHVPTADTRILDKGTAYQTDIGMCGDYNSVIGMNKENSIKKFFKDKDAIKHFPSSGVGTLSGVIVDADTKSGLAKKSIKIISWRKFGRIVMAGHSHWAGIKHKKGRADKERSKIFSKLSREITVAAKLGDKDPDMNPRLRTAIQAAKNANMPKDNISRAISRSEVSDDKNYENLRYEGFGPFNTALIIETLTDNKNRSASSIRTVLQKWR